MKQGGALRLVLGDQLSGDISSLSGLDPARDVVLMAEVRDETRYVRHHPKKIVLILSAMRHFADRLRAEGIVVDYVALDSLGNTGSFRGEVLRAVERHQPERIVVTHPGEWRVLDDICGWQQAAGVHVELRDDTRFFCPIQRFHSHAEGRRQLRMEFFYREMRRESGLLMDGEEPAGGAWNFDAENRKRLPAGLNPPVSFAIAPDEITQAVLALVARECRDHFGSLDDFAFAVTAADAERAFEHFLDHGLARFGDYQDAMAVGQDLLFHSLISPYLNIGLLDPQTVCRRVEQAWRDGRVPLNSAEGFIRQILGWREFVRGIYWLKMPGYARTNILGARRSLPGFYWTADTDMTCIAEVVDQTRRLAYAHHIQRLMVTGNFALLAGIAPAQVEEWYLSVYADAFDWVELPNTHGMALHADGGFLGSKPYAASGKYIDRMSDYCRSCRYDVRETTAANACPFNFLYWNFLIEHEARFRANMRMKMMYASLDRMDAAKRSQIRDRARQFLDQVAPALPD